MVSSLSMTPFSLRRCPRMIRPSRAGTLLAQMRCRKAKASGPATSNFAKVERSMSPPRSRSFQPVMQRGGPEPAPDLFLLARPVAIIHVFVVGDRDRRRIVRRRPVAEAARVELAHVDLGLAVYHP